MDARRTWAALNNAEWCDVVARSHGVETEIDREVWIARTRTPPYYPDAITMQQHAQAALDAGWSGVVIWALGYETADVYTALANTVPG
jgi:hypothetical protein